MPDFDCCSICIEAGVSLISKGRVEIGFLMYGTVQRLEQATTASEKISKYFFGYCKTHKCLFFDSRSSKMFVTAGPSNIKLIILFGFGHKHF